MMKSVTCICREGLLLTLVILVGMIPNNLHAQPWVQDLPPAPLEPVKTAEQLAARRQALEEEKANIERIRQELRALSEEMPRRIAELEVGDVTEVMLEQARVDVSSAKLRLEDLQVDLANAERRIKELEQSIRDLEAREQLLRNPAKEEVDSALRTEQLQRTTQALAQQRTELEMERLHRENLRKRIELASTRLNLFSQWLNRVEEVYRLQQEQLRREAQEDLEQRLKKEQQAYLERAAELTQRLEQERGTISEARRRLLETSIQSAEERAKLYELDIRLSRISNDLARLKDLTDKAEPSSKELQDGLDQLRALREELQATDALLQRKINLFEQQKQVIDKREGLLGADSRAAVDEARLITDLLGELRRRSESVQEQLVQIEAIMTQLEASYRETLRKDLFNRRQLPGTAEEWQQLLEAIVNAPKVMFYQVQLSVQTAVNAMVDTSPLRWFGLLALELGLLWLVTWARRALAQAIERTSSREDTTFYSNLALNLFVLLRKNLLGIGPAAAVLIAIWMAEVPQPGLGIISTLVLLWVGIKLPIDLAWMLLASPRIPAEQQRPQLYRQLRWTLLSGGILAVVTLLAHLSSLPGTVIDTFDRLFMLYLLLIFVPILRIRRFLHDRLAQRYAGHSWFIILHLVTLLLPLSLFAAAVLGLVGYLNLAWSVAWHLLMFLLVLVGWLLIRGLLNDLVILLKNYAVTHSDYGLLWTQEVITPFHRILRVALFFAAWVVLFQIYGLEGESTIVATFWEILEKPLFTLGGAEISLWRIIFTVLIFLIVIWFGQWTRAVTYRWVYSRIVDLGARHSLSVFTQYAIVLIGVLAILRTIGLDLTTLTVFAGAVGVGIGFGMQTIANNFISGLLLLIERPLRSGDIVKIGTSEGEVSRIGMRSLTMKTFDNLEVIIPNSDVITNAFTNWTHTDKVIRTVLMLRVTYDSDPHKVSHILEKAVFTHPAILADPEPMVLLWEFSESCMLFRIQYFTDVIKHSILRVRSEINFAIWDSLKRAGIRIPYPQQDLFIKEWPEISQKGGRQGETTRKPEDDQRTPQSPNTPLIGI